MKNLITTVLLLISLNTSFGQTKVNVSLVGSVVNYSTSEKLFGATLYFMQNGKTVGKSISDETGRYSISALVSKEEPIDLLISKPGYASKKVLFDLKSMGKTSSVQLVEEIIIQLHENCEGANLSFTKSEYAEKFTWTGNAAEPDKNYKNQIDDKIVTECSKVKKNSSSKNFVSRADIASKNREFDKAIAYYDSAMVYSPADSSIRVKKEIVLNTIKKIQEEEAKKAAYAAKKILADNAFNSGDLATAEKNYKEMLVDLPGDTYATSQITKVAALKTQQEQEKRNKAEAEKLITQATTLKSSKKYEDAISKLKLAIDLDPTRKDDLNKEINAIKAIQSDIALEEQVKKDLENAANLFKDKKFDEAIKTYEGVDQKITKFTNEALKNSLSKMSQDGAQKVKVSKEEVKTQLKRAQDIYDKGPAFYNEAENILNGAPLKSLLNDPEVIALKDKISKMKDFYNQKSDAYNEVKNKKNNEALAKLKSTRDFAKKIGNIAPQSELTIIQSSIDSLTTILQPQNSSNQNQTNTTVTSGPSTTLSAPGELVTGNTSDVYEELSENIESQKNAPLKNLENLKNEIDSENYFQSKLNASRQEDERKGIQNLKNDLELKAIEQEKQSSEIVQNMNETKQKFEKEVYDATVENNLKSESRMKDLQNLKDKNDSLNVVRNNERQIQSENNQRQIQEFKNNVELKAIESNKENQQLIEASAKVKTEFDLVNFRKDSIVKAQDASRMGDLQKLKDFRKEEIMPANNLKDENGVLFPKNKMTEKTYKIKNKEGFVTTIITRRVVVDKNGYGVVYEQTTNDRGIHSYTKNNSVITEYIWFKESTGVDVIEK
jgi:hypothetical protein